MQLTWDLLHSLTKTYGDSFYILETEIFRQNFENLQAAFRVHYPNSWIAYSYKTNYTPRLCKLVQELGGYAEIVSEMELALTRKLGIPPEKVIYNGPFKSAASIESCLLSGGLVNIDAVEELEIIEAVAHAHPGSRLALGIRCNFDIGEGEVSRFGVDVTSPDFTEIIRRLKALPSASLKGLHCHFPFRKIETYPARIDTMLKLATEHFTEPLEFIDIGGGYFGNMSDSLRSQFRFKVPAYQDYADIIASRMAAAFAHLEPSRRPKLFLEPGTAVVADAMQYVAKVTCMKTVRGKKIAVVAGSKFNISPTAGHINLPMDVFNQVNGDNDGNLATPVDISGYTCIEGDYLNRNFTGSLERGDFVAFKNVGSYSIVMKPPFILPNRSILEFDEKQQAFNAIKRQETFEDIFNTFDF